jgi:hypothetical protein
MTKKISFQIGVRSTLIPLLTATLLAGSFTPNRAAAAKNPTPDYYHCVGKVGGDYTFGRAPQACNASSFGDDKFVQAQFSPIVFMDAEARTAERNRYSQELHGALREAATYYIKKRNPNVTTTEINWWVTLVLVTASHETYWSHYRTATDAKLKLMRGDAGHGHGLMQIDDRYHFPAITNGTAWNLVGNLIYAMDILYPDWVRAPSKTCVKNEANYIARIRSTWSAYNGGDSQICRWTNPNDTWAKNDEGFYRHLTNKYYEKFVADKTKPSSMNMPCLMERHENCPAKGPAPTPDLQQGILYQAKDGRSCVINNEKAYCVDQVRDAICLNSITGFTGKAATQIETAALARYAPTTVDRHRLCAAYDPTLIGVSSTLEIKKTVNLRNSPGGGLLGAIPTGQLLEVLDFEMRNAPDNDRYYKVRYNGEEGFVFGGNSEDFASWAISSVDSAIATLAKVGERIRIVNPAGINLRTAAGGAFVVNVPVRTELQVLAISIQGSENGVYYKVSYAGRTGYIYSGLLMPANTTGQWTQVLR